MKKKVWFSGRMLYVMGTGFPTNESVKVTFLRNVLQKNVKLFNKQCVTLVVFQSLDITRT